MKLSRVASWSMLLTLNVCSLESQTIEKAMAMKIYYVSFAIDTYLPLTRSSFDTATVADFEITSTKQKNAVLKLIKWKVGGPKIAENRIRLKVINGDEILYVDQDGCVEDLHGARFQANVDLLKGELSCLK